MSDCIFRAVMEWKGEIVYLGLDIGTSGVKAVVLDSAGKMVAQASASLPISRPEASWSEQNASDWWAATNKAVSNLDSQARRQVRAIGLSGQMHGATLLDKQGQALRPAILWNDGRAFAECAELEAEVPNLAQISGNRAMPGFTAPKLRWVAKHEPQVFDKIAKVLLPKDYVRLRMTGEYASDVSDSAGTLWLDVAKRDWSEELLSVCGLSREQMPALHEGPQVTGNIRTELAEAWGMAAVPVIAGGGDNAAGAVGVGVVGEGEAFLSLGTSGVLFVANDGYRPNPAGGVHCFCHALPNRWHQMSVILSAASCMDWAAKLTGQTNAMSLFDKVAGAGHLTGNEIFLPYLSGERTPHNNPNARGVLFGLDHDSDPAKIGRAVLEGVAFAFRDGMDALKSAGSSIDNVTVIGGGSQSKFWGSMLANILEMPMVYREGGEVGPAFGAARLAQLGMEDGDIASVCHPSAIVEVIEPDHRISEQLLAKLPTYRSIYSNLEHLFGEHN